MHGTIKFKTFIFSQNGNYTDLLGPVIDDTISDKLQQFIPDDPRKLLRLNTMHKIPIIIGITNNEGAFLKNQWINLSKQGYKSLKQFIDNTIISNTIEMLEFNSMGHKQVRDTIYWKFFDQIPKTNVYLLNALQRILSETKFELPFFETIEVLSSEGRVDTDSITGIMINETKEEIFNVSNINQKMRISKRKTNEHQLIYVYSFQHSNSIDMRGKVNYFGGASHSSDLPILMGPSLFQQISRRRMTSQEDKFSKRVRQMFCDFIKSRYEIFIETNRVI